jgi:ABC-type multidrug transport system ATPase subunit
MMAAGESMAVVELAGVTKAYESKVAVNNLSLSIDAGQMFGLLGPNGAGKTSSIRMMMGITIPDRAASTSSKALRAQKPGPRRLSARGARPL